MNKYTKKIVDEVAEVMDELECSSEAAAKIVKTAVENDPDFFADIDECVCEEGGVCHCGGDCACDEEDDEELPFSLVVGSGKRVQIPTTYVEDVGLDPKNAPWYRYDSEDGDYTLIGTKDSLEAYVEDNDLNTDDIVEHSSKQQVQFSVAKFGCIEGEYLNCKVDYLEDFIKIEY